jgi:uncharacterized integral membrane protein (TIGR00697 family)
MSQIIATKIAAFNLGFKVFYAPAAVLIFPFTFQMNDIVNEAFGRFEVHRMIFIAFITQVIMTFFIWLGDLIPAAPFWAHPEAFHQILGLVPRITLASWIAFLVSENLDAVLYAKLRKLTKGKYLWIRNLFSDIPSLAIDSIIFITLAFYKITPIVPLIVGQIVLKWLFSIVDTPLMYLSRRILYRVPYKCATPLDE